jgi:hypothetical protein
MYFLQNRDKINIKKFHFYIKKLSCAEHGGMEGSTTRFVGLTRATSRVMAVEQRPPFLVCP